MQKWMDFKNPTHHIDRVVQTPQEVAKNRLRLTTTIEAIRYLANQGMTFKVMMNLMTPLIEAISLSW